MPIEPVEHSADSSSSLDGSIRPSSIPRLEESQNLRPLMTTPRPGPGPGPGLPISLVTSTKLYQCTIWALIHSCESHGCHGLHSPRRHNIPHKRLPLGGPAWYFSHNFRPMPIEPVEHSADSSSNLDGSIKPSIIPRLEESQNLRPLMNTPAPRAGVRHMSTYV